MHKRAFLSILSGILLALAYPNLNVEILAWIAFVPLFFAIKNRGAKEAFLLSFLTGIVFYSITIYWLIYVSGIGLAFLILYSALYFGLFGLLVRSRTTNHEPRITNAFIIAATWVTLEYIRANAFTGFGWALLGYSQYLNLSVIQIADITGAYGISFLIMLVNATIFGIIIHLKERKLSSFSRQLSAVSVLVLLTVVYGHFKLSAPLKGDKLRISVIQGNIPQVEKWDPELKNDIFTKYERLTLEASADKPDLMIWPETSFPGVPREEPIFLDKLKFIAKRTKSDMLIGAPALAEEWRLYNSAILINGEGRIQGRYDKLHLVPFGEYVPFENILGIVRSISDKPIGDFIKGGKYTIFESNNRRFGVLICFEDIFPGLVRGFVKKGADFMVNITNDAWFMDSSAPYQHAQASVFRAVENRVPFVRSANTGLSGFIDPNGRITGTVSKEGDEIFVDGFKTAEVKLAGGRSFYSKYGDIFSFGCILTLLFGGLYNLTLGRL